ncbi:hypothetical protein EC973_000806 [Apophysomyces ossiformis]|uniref:rhizopuspepsin n=1 Tax=Apophysomyces ossiformis TaxID=679940 RepID=A0A8H7BMZ0_9FUNG|nr:hypothetical protein EC973_000806 [Apophysomyces ossiformis]
MKPSHTLTRYLLILSYLFQYGYAGLVMKEPIRLPIRRITHKAFNQTLNGLKQMSLGLETSLLNDLEMHELGVQVAIGTPPQEFLLLLDSGSSDTWIPSKRCQLQDGCPSSNHYDPAASSTYNASEYDYSLQYVTGSTTGNYFQDSITIGDVKNTGQFMATIDTMTGPLVNQKAIPMLDGILGAGFPYATSMYFRHKKLYQPVPFSLWEKKLIPEPLYSVYVGESEHTDWAGELTFGGIDYSKIDGDILYANIPRYNIRNGPSGVYFVWNVLVSGVRFETPEGVVGTLAANNGYISFAVDTGSDGIFMPSTDSDTLISNMIPSAEKRNSLYYVDCSYRNSTQMLAFNLHPSTTNMDSERSSIQVPIGQLVRPSLTGNQCVLAIVSGNTNNFIIGNIFLRHYVTVFDFGKHRIGFGTLKK